jgi:integrase
MVATNAVKLTKRQVDALAPREKPFIVFDADVKGFGLRIMPTGSKTFIVEYRPGAGGRGVLKRRLTLGRYGALTADEARKAAKTALATVRLGADPQGEKSQLRAALTVSALITAFLEGHALKPSSRAAYVGWLGKVRTAYGTVKAEALTRGQLAALHRSMVAAPYAANRVLAAVSSLYSWAENQGLIPEGHANPAAKIQRYREQARERFLTGDELARLGDALRAENLDPFVVAAVRLLTLTGARMSEILHARWEHVDVERGILFLPDSKSGPRPIFLNGAALAVLKHMPRLDGSRFLFPGRKDGAPRLKLEKPWAIIRKSAGLDGLRLHDLRHSFASVGAGASLGLPILGKLLGHTLAATTQRYAHLSNDPVRAAAETIGSRIDAAMNREAAK